MQDNPSPVRNKVDPSSFQNSEVLLPAGLNSKLIASGINHTHDIIDIIDEKLIFSGSNRLSSIIELANLSSMVGNLLGAGIATASKGVFKRNGPHKYPDLLAQKSEAKDVEIKVALEKNKPKGHLAKPGYYLTCRYLLGDKLGNYRRGRLSRGDIVWIWEVRFGWLELRHFNLSNTQGDSGKTAVVNAEGMSALKVIYQNGQLNLQQAIVSAALEK